ncbi:1-phosphatidylinositol 3-phosphate 5-kinase-like isoform X3 [Lineus longissimus]|uniref:1-phosphatidylinositol 3-phosphate 5-kinase-like isoform X3 n=1 Tax=Lineus longissimus TaxID=88925 RepID=UPI002B4F5712
MSEGLARSPSKAKHENDQQRLTEFQPLSSEVKPSGGFLSRLLKRSKDERKSPKSSPSKASPKRSPSPGVTFRVEYKDVDTDVFEADDSPSRTPKSEDSGSDVSKDSTPSVESAGSTVPQIRTLSNVLRRLGSILDRKGQTLQAYRDSDFKQYWMPDDTCKDCYECGDKFTTFRRRHHCRICGQIFCSRCCNQEVPGRIFGYTGDLRVCTYCCKVVLNYAQQTDSSGDLRALREDLKSLANIESEGGAYQEFGRWTPSRKRNTGPDEECLGPTRSGSLSEPLTRQVTPFDITPQSEYRSMETMNIERRILTKDSAQLRELWNQMQQLEEGIQFQSHRLRLRTYHNCFSGKELVDWLIQRDKVTTPVQAIAIGQALLDARLITGVNVGDQLFRDEYVLYKAAQRESPTQSATLIETIIVEDEFEPNWTKDIKQEGDDHDYFRRANSSLEDDKITTEIEPAEVVSARAEEQSTLAFYDTFGSTPPSGNSFIERPKTLRNVSISSEKSLKEGMDPNMLVHQDSTVSRGINEDLLQGALASKRGLAAEDYPDWWQTINAKQEHGNSVDSLAYERLRKAQYEHMSMLTSQLLSNEGLSLSWAELILQISRRIAEMVSPDVKMDEDDMDIRQYVQIKKIPGGQKIQTNIVQGAVCSKHVAHKKMQQNITSPRILLLKAAIEYQRIENKFSSLEPQILQEKEFLRNCIAKIASLRPDILMVERTVSRIAQDFILESGITLVLNVKPSVMERVARFTQAEVVHSIDGLVSKPRLGLCHNFRINSFELPNGMTKTLMYFDGCATHLGCTVTLRGGSSAELKRVKKILQFVIYIAYHFKLETSFVMDASGMPPAHPSEASLNMECFENSSEDSLSSPEKPVIETFETYNDRLKQGSFIAKLVNKPTTLRDSSRETAKLAPQAENSGADDIHENAVVKEITMENDVDKQPEIVAKQPEVVAKQPDSVAENEIGKVGPGFMKAGNGQSEKVSSNTNGNRLSVIDEKPDSAHSEKKDSSLKQIGQVTDFSDPLHHYQQNQDESVFKTSENSLKEEVKNDCFKFKKALDDAILSGSPYLRYSVPYLLTEAGCKCILRSFFPREIYWSATVNGERMRSKNFDLEPEEKNNNTRTRISIEWVNPHPFVQCTLTGPIFDSKNQALLADFRARGGQIRLLNRVEIREKMKRGNQQMSLETPNDQPVPLPANGVRLCWERKIDCLDPYQHQRIAVLFSSYSYISANAPNACINPWVVTMDFYGRNDITLGNFLERFCFRDSYLCPSEVCGTPMTDHIRRFVHGTGCVHIVLKKLSSAALGYSNNIVMWNWCRKCKKITQPVPMSNETWSMSFAKYLEIRFHGNVYTRRGEAETCVHSLHHDHYQYFGFKQTVAAFKYSNITLKEIVLPPLKVDVVEETVLPDTAFDEVRRLKIRVNEIYSTVIEHLCRLDLPDIPAKMIADYKTQLHDEQKIMREHVEALQSKCVVPKPLKEELQGDDEASSEMEEAITEVHEKLFAIEDSIVLLKKMMAEAVTSWNLKIQDLLTYQKKQERSSKSSSKFRDSGTTPDSIHQRDCGTPDSVDAMVVGATPPKFIIGENEGLDADNVSRETGSMMDADAEVSERSSLDGDVLQTPAADCQDSQEDVDSSCSYNKSKMEKEIEEAMMENTSHALTVPGSHDSSTSKEESYTYMGVSPGMNAGIWSHTGSSEGYLLPPIKLRAFTDSSNDYVLVRPRDDPLETSGDHLDGNASSSLASDSKEFSSISDSQDQLNPRRSQSVLILERHKPMLRQPATYAQGLDEKTEKKSVKKMLTDLLTGSINKLLQMPFPDDEHHLLPACRKVPIVIYDEEPSSIIAYSLSSQDYEIQRQELLLMMQREKSVNSAASSPATKRKTNGTNDSDSDTGSKNKSNAVLSFFRSASNKERERSPGRPVKASEVETVKYTRKLDSDNVELDQDIDEPDFAFYSTNDAEKTKGPNPHVELQFSDTNAKFYCRVYFAEQFRQLRKLIFPAGEERYIRSLSRCIHWMARGGKSGSAFCKTRDDRFVLKQMSRLEVQSFVDFAPKYFQYMTMTHNEEKPTALAKIFGVYRVVFRNSQTNTASKQDLLVIENLFYGRRISQVFDLKGSVRNRLVNTQGKREEDLVLLDENLLKLIVDSPLYIRPHSKTVLTLAITNDTQFLSSHLVMDYSLLVGLDSAKKELVIGIIDYIRTFTWDKKLEMVVKSTGLLGGQGKMPTVVSPELYRTRFLEAMDRYFLLVPDQWSGLGRNVDC